MKNNNPSRIPYSEECEQAVLTSLMFDSSRFDEVLALIKPSDFYRIEHRLIFDLMCKMIKKSESIDIWQLINAAQDSAELRTTDINYILDLSNNAFSSANILGYAQIVRDKSTSRKILDKIQGYQKIIATPDDKSIDEILQDIQIELNSIDKATQKDTENQAMKCIMRGVIEDLDDAFNNKGALTGLSTGFKDIDGFTAGINPADLIIIAARPSMGKTSFAMNIAEHVAIKQAKNVLVFSLEMPASSLGKRLLASLARINLKKTKTGEINEEDWPRIANATSALASTSLEIDDTSSICLNDMRLRIKQYIKKHGKIDLIVVDYLQLMREKGFKSENRVGEISAISQGLKAIAKDFKVPLIALSQLNRNLENRTDKRPVMADIRESGAIEQDADLILFIYRDEVYNESSQDKGIAEIIVAKNRNGEIGKSRVVFNGQYTRFEDHYSH